MVVEVEEEVELAKVARMEVEEVEAPPLFLFKTGVEVEVDPLETGIDEGGELFANVVKVGVTVVDEEDGVI